jgi:hypothetical protein
MNATATAPRRAIHPAHGTLRLTATIAGQTYAVRPLPTEPAAGVSRLIRLRKADGTVYHVHADDDGRHGCDCPDFELTRRDVPGAGPCKHIAAMQACGLLPAPARADDFAPYEIDPDTGP